MFDPNNIPSYASNTPESSKSHKNLKHFSRCHIFVVLALVSPKPSPARPCLRNTAPTPKRVTFGQVSGRSCGGGREGIMQTLHYRREHANMHAIDPRIWQGKTRPDKARCQPRPARPPSRIAEFDTSNCLARSLSLLSCCAEIKHIWGQRWNNFNAT